MNLLAFLEQFGNKPAFSVRELEQIYPRFERENLLNWQKKGYIVRIRNGWYSRTGKITTEAHLYWVANKIYHPSYVSMETAFSHYGWIPEAVFTITSVSTRKTQTFDTAVGHFRYATIKPSLFFGYRLLPVEGYGAKMAEPEKALLDFLYLRPTIATSDDFEALRLNVDQVKADINPAKLEAYCSLFNTHSLSERVRVFLKYTFDAQPS